MTDEATRVQRRRFVDAHVHLWDAANGWYFFPTTDNDFGLGDVSTLPTVFLLDDYRHAVSTANVVKFVHVSATATPAGAMEETRWLAQLAARTGTPNAIIGTLDTDKPFAMLQVDLDDHMATPLFRGIRLLHGLDYDSAVGHDLMQLLSDRKLVYDVVAHPDGSIAAAARAAARHPDLPFIMEHTGWPLQTDAAHWDAWKGEMGDFAAVPGTVCKLSGLGMTYHRTDEAVFRRYWEHCIDIFGPDRCMFASNFPVDRLYGPFDGLLEVFESVAATLSPHDADLLFGGTAERVYKI